MTHRKKIVTISVSFRNNSNNLNLIKAIADLSATDRIFYTNAE